MCRSIKQLRHQAGNAGDDEVEAAALQFVRKISGYRTPARKNSDAFERAVAEITEASRRMLAEMAPDAAAKAARVD